MHSQLYPTFPLEQEIPLETGTQQTIELDTIDRYGAYWAEILFLNRSDQAVQTFSDPTQRISYTIPPQTQATLEGWGRYIKIISGLNGFGPESNFHLTLARREDVLRPGAPDG